MQEQRYAKIFKQEQLSRKQRVTSLATKCTRATSKVKTHL